MNAMMIDRFGGSHEFYVGDAPIVEPAPDEVLIRAVYASVNPADWKCRAGLLPILAGRPFPMILGMDCAGSVERVGPQVTEFKPGDRVITLSGVSRGKPGTYAEFCTAPQQRVFHAPAHLTVEEAATIPIAAASAASSILDVAKVKSGDIVFLNGGAGSVGTFGVQFLRHLGARVAATCSSRNVDYVRGLGAERVIDYTKENVSDALRAWAPHGLDCVIDAVGQHSLSRDLPALIKRGGILVCIQNLLTGPDAFDLTLAAERNVRVLDNVVAARTPDASNFQVAAFRQLLAAIDAKTVKVPPYEILSIKEVAKAQDKVQEGHVRGKILLKIADFGSTS